MKHFLNSDTEYEFCNNGQKTHAKWALSTMHSPCIMQKDTSLCTVM